MDNYLVSVTVPVVNPKEVGERIKMLRKARNLKVTDISNMMGFESPQAVYKWQRGECFPDIVNLIILSRILGTTVEGIILGEEEMSSSHFIPAVNCDAA